jgi:hypothetical protein
MRLFAMDKQVLETELGRRPRRLLYRDLQAGRIRGVLVDGKRLIQATELFAYMTGPRNRSGGAA